MPTTPAYALPYPAATDPADVPADVKKLADQIALVMGGALSQTPPASPIDGQLWAYPLQSAPFGVWVFRYNSSLADAFKWQFVGGPELSSYDAPSRNGDLPASGWVSPFSPAVIVTAPRAGEYLVHAECTLFPLSVSGSDWLGVKVGTTNPTQDGSLSSGGYHPAASARVPFSLRGSTSVAAAGTQLQQVYAAAAAGIQTFTRAAAYLSILPVRVS